MAKLQFETEQFKHFVANVRETFWGDVDGKTKQLWEVAVRAALGAGRGRLVAQFFTESLVLAGLGALAGLALAVPAMRFLEILVPETMGTVHLKLDWRVLASRPGQPSRRQ